ncbi:hypothetical protein RB653_002691 [Dictyostelium firmibasis]|uniref:Guanylate cyclase domain-containing protein n=1 Tax=Dictyostelium firmibasis TaxID=79012 RepID=A0AAN7U9W2_9MYCE
MENVSNPSLLSLSLNNNSNTTINNNNNNNVPYINSFNVNQLDEFERKTIEYGRSIVYDIARIEELILASEFVSELEIVMFSRRVTSKCSELSTAITPNIAVMRQQIQILQSTAPIVNNSSSSSSSSTSSSPNQSSPQTNRRSAGLLSYSPSSSPNLKSLHYYNNGNSSSSIGNSNNNNNNNNSNNNNNNTQLSQSLFLLDSKSIEKMVKEECFGIIDPEELSHEEKSKLIRSTVSSINSIIMTVKEYNKQHQLGKDLLPLQNEYFLHRTNILLSWKFLTIFVSKTSWKIPKLPQQPTKSCSSSSIVSTPVLRQIRDIKTDDISTNNNNNSNSNNSGGSGSVPSSPILSGSPSSSISTPPIPTSPTLQPEKPLIPPILGSASSNKRLSMSFNSFFDANSGVVNGAINLQQQLSSSPENSPIVSRAKGSNIITLTKTNVSSNVNNSNNNSSSPTQSSKKQHKSALNVNSSVSLNNNSSSSSSTTSIIKPDLFDQIFQLNDTLMTLMYHLKNLQKIKLKKQQQQQGGPVTPRGVSTPRSTNNNNNNSKSNNSSPTNKTITTTTTTRTATITSSPINSGSTTPVTQSPPLSPTSTQTNNQSSPPLSSTSTPTPTPKIGSLYIEQAKNVIIPNLLSKLLDICNHLKIKITDESLIDHLFNLSSINSNDLIEPLEIVLEMFQKFTFSQPTIVIENPTTSTTGLNINNLGNSKTTKSKPPHHPKSLESKNHDKTSSSPIKSIFKLNTKVKDKSDKPDSNNNNNSKSRPTTPILSPLSSPIISPVSSPLTSPSSHQKISPSTSLERVSDLTIISSPSSNNTTNTTTTTTTTTATTTTTDTVQNQNLIYDLLNTIDNNENNEEMERYNVNSNNTSPISVVVSNNEQPVTTYGFKVPELNISKLNDSNNNNNNSNNTNSGNLGTSINNNNNKKLNQILGASEDVLSKKQLLKPKDLSKQNKIGLSIFSKHLRSMKQNDEHQQRNSFNQFWLEGSTHRERQDQVPLDEKQRHQITSLGSYVSNLVIKGLLASATPIVPPHLEKYSSCVLFADISGFTSLTERLGNHGKEGVELLTKNLNSYFTILIKIVKGFGGDIVKFAGDAVLAHWPTNGELINRVRIACECSLALQKKLHNFPVPGGFLTLHIGIGCGDISGVYVGGCKEKVEFLICGEALIQATLCEKEAESGEIYVSPATQEKMKPYATFSQKKQKHNYKLESITTLLEKDLINDFDFLSTMVGSQINHKFLQELPLLMDMEDSLKRFVPNAVHNQFKNDYLAELRFITVLFMNLSYGTPNPDTDLDKLQNIVFESQAIVYKHEGTVRQFIVDDKGCVLIAAWGVPPHSHEDDPSRAVEAAMEIVVNVFKLAVISSVGITTGKCFCGDVGSDERREYAVVGDIVNLAARLMSHSQGGVLCDEETSKTAKMIEFVKLANPIKVKGKVAPINVYKPIKKLQSMKNSSPRHMIKNKGIIGRHTQLRQMANIIDQITSNSGPTHVAIIEAEAGLGKSRFISEIKYSFCMDLKMFKASGIQMSESISFYIWKQILSPFLKEESVNGYPSFTDLTSTQIQLLNQVLDTAIPITLSNTDGGTEKLPVMIEQLQTPVGKLTSEESKENRRYSAQQRAESLQLIMMKLLTKAIPTGSIIVIDDAQFMDSASWTLTLNAVKNLANCLIIISLRPSKDGIPYGFSQLASELVTKIQLEPLSGKVETTLLVERMLDFPSDEGGIPDEIIEEIYNRSQGNHFVIEEMVNGLISNGLIDEASSRFINPKEAIDHVRLSLPRTVTSLITSRVDRLSPIQQLELKIASVIGMPFTVDSLHRILPLDAISKQDLAKDLAVLERLDFIKSTTINTQQQLLQQLQQQQQLQKQLLNNQADHSSYKSNNIMLLASQPSNNPNGGNGNEQQPSTPTSIINNNLLYSFHHTRTQEVIYDLMLFSQRRELHQKIAKVLEDTCTPQHSLFISLVHHYHSAQNNPKTIEYATKAGALAQAENNNKEAIKFFQLALKCMEQEFIAEEEVKLHKKLHRRSSSQNLKDAISTSSNSNNPNNISLQDLMDSNNANLGNSSGSGNIGSSSNSNNNSIGNLGNMSAENDIKDSKEKDSKDSKEKDSKESKDKEKDKEKDKDKNNNNNNNNTINNPPTLADLVGLGFKKVPIEIISITRKLGLALFNVGRFRLASYHLLNALKYLGLEPPTPKDNSSGASKPKLRTLAKAAVRQDSATKFFSCNLDMLEKREAMLCLFVQSKISLHDCSKTLDSWCSYVSLQLSFDNVSSKNKLFNSNSESSTQNLPDWNLQAEAYSIGIRVLGNNGDSSTPLKYYAEVLSKMDQTNGFVYGNSHQSWGIYMSGLSRWEEAESAYKKSIEASHKTGDKKLMEESNIFLSLCYLLLGNNTGKIPLIYQQTTKALESARNRGDYHNQILALTMEACTLFYERQFQRCQSIIHDIERLVDLLSIKELSNSAHANYTIIKAQLAINEKDWQLAYDCCRRVSIIISKCDSNNFSMYESYTGLPLVLIKILQNHQHISATAVTVTKSRLVTEINDSIIVLERFSDTFPIGQPRLLLVKTLMLALGYRESSDDQNNLSALKEAKEKCQKLGMSFDFVCIHNPNNNNNGSPSTTASNSGNNSPINKRYSVGGGQNEMKSPILSPQPVNDFHNAITSDSSQPSVQIGGSRSRPVSVHENVNSSQPPRTVSSQDLSSSSSGSTNSYNSVDQPQSPPQYSSTSTTNTSPTNPSQQLSPPNQPSNNGAKKDILKKIGIKFWKE